MWRHRPRRTRTTDYASSHTSDLRCRKWHRQASQTTEKDRTPRRPQTSHYVREVHLPFSGCCGSQGRCRCFPLPLCSYLVVSGYRCITVFSLRCRQTEIPLQMAHPRPADPSESLLPQLRRGLDTTASWQENSHTAVCAGSQCYSAEICAPGGVHRRREDEDGEWTARSSNDKEEVRIVAHICGFDL